MKKKTIVISAIAAFVAIGVIGTAVGGNSSNSSQAPENLSVSETNSSQSKDNEGKQGEEVSSSVNGEQTADDETSIGIDGTLHAEDFDFSIKDIKWTDALETSIGTITPDEEGKKLLCIIFSAKNTTDTTQNVANIGFNSYVDGKKVLYKVVTGYIDEAMVLVGAVSSGMEMVGYSVWELPENWEEFQTSYISGLGIESKQHFVIHKDDIK